MVSRQISLSLQLAGLKSGDPVQFELMRHWLALKGKVDSEIWAQAFQSRWQKSLELADLLIPGIEDCYPTTISEIAKTETKVERTGELVLSFSDEEKPWPFIEVEFLRAANPATFRNHSVKQTARFFDNKDRFLVSGSSHSEAASFVVIHRPTGTHKTIDFHKIKVVYHV